jgi:hypothetical protein
LPKIALALALALITSVAAITPTPVAASGAGTSPKVVIIVGATHGLTSNFRGYADLEYAEAIKHTDNVVKVYSPNATWDVVQEAVRGASIVIYHGHGNGCPSPYGGCVPPWTTKNGFGLNDAAKGLSDYNNTYYGEPWIRTLELAPNAIVLLHNLCYAAGNSEPGHGEPTLEVAQQRADNYAAGFLAAGARAVIAGGHENAVHYLRSLFTTSQTVDEMWLNAPTANGNTFSFPSVRTPGATVRMDPETPTTRFYRAISGDLSLRTDEVIEPGTAQAGTSSGMIGSTYTPLDALRVLDTRTGTGLSGAFVSRKARTFQVTGLRGVPSDAIAVSGNVTVTGQTSAGYLSLGPAVQVPPSTSSLNFPAGDTRANGVVVPLGPGGTLDAVFMGAAGATAHVAFDVTGYFRDGIEGATYEPVGPARILDSRFGNGLDGAFISRSPRSFQVTGHAGIPDDAIAVTGNLTVTQQTSAGYLTLGSTVPAAPSFSTLPFPRGDNRANMVFAKLAGDGTLGLVFVGSAGATAHAIFDVTGYFRPGSGGSVYVALDPARLLDTRAGNGLPGAFTSTVVRTFQVSQRGGVPAQAVGVTGNLTVTQQTNAGYASLGPQIASRPTTSTINFPVGDNRANGVVVPLAGDGALSAVYVGGSGSTHLILDVTGYFVPLQ